MAEEERATVIETVYVAGGYYDVPGVQLNGRGRLVKFELVCASYDKRPFMTKDPNGLYHTGHHANLYRVSPDFWTLTMAQYRCSNVQPPNWSTTVELTEEQKRAVKLAYETGYFYDGGET